VLLILLFYGKIKRFLYILKFFIEYMFCENSDLSNQRRTITRVRVAITNGVGTYNVTQVGLSGGNCIPVIYSMSDGIFWSEVSVAIQNDLVVVGFSSGQSGWAEVNIFSFE
jgi:hypothetical protein